MEDNQSFQSLKELIFSRQDWKNKRENSCSSVTNTDLSQFPVCVQESLSKLSLLVRCADCCVVLEGPTGCGKTMLVETLASIQCHDLMVVHLGEQIDAKVLLSTFTSTATPGEFVWKPGPLTKATESGMWLLMEDIDLATPDVLGLLLPLIKSRELMIPGYTQSIRAAQNFVLFLTQRTSAEGGSPLSPTFPMLQLLKQHATVLSLSPLTPTGICQILKTKYPGLSKFVDTLVSATESLDVHIRQLLKVCERVAPQVYNGRITSSEDFMLEVIDCLCGHLSLTEKEKMAVKFGGLVGGISRPKVEQLCRSHRPALQLSQTTLSVGRAHLTRVHSGKPEVCFAHTSAALRLLEGVCRCVQMNEPVLLVGETGVGKTAVVNFLSKVTGNKLVVFNMSEQTESTDLLGGFRPVQISRLVDPVKAEFEKLFHATFSLKENGPFLSSIQDSYTKQRWKKLLKLMAHSVESGIHHGGRLSSEWKNLAETLARFQKQLAKSQSTFAFEFVEGALVEAVRSGSWILLDEVNLASSETLQCLSGLLESPHGSFILPEKLEAGLVKRHSEFRLFCCMNPATDVGKKSLPRNIRNRLTEFFVDELHDSSDLRLLVQTYLQNVSPPVKLVDGIIRLHLALKELADSRLQDGTGRRPHYSLRNLCRALTYCQQVPCGTLLRSAYEGFCLSFLSEVRSDYHPMIVSLITQHLSIPKASVSAPLPCPAPRGFIKVEGFWLHRGTIEATVPEGYILTESVKRNIKNLARVITARSYPVLLQGPTSAGKTSMIQYLAKTLGHKYVRINNHEHTDLQEYVGMYTANSQGQLVFQEGVLVDAMKHGYWIILDELNLAPTEVLEALNRVLDDNRELFIPETQELVKAHPNFLLFGTQNPPGVYAGRKVLSRAFRNRFIELHVDDIPPDELVLILQERCSLPASYAKKMVAIMKELQMVRSKSGIFQGKYGLITLRDLFRWAERYRRSETSDKFYDWEQQLAEDGLMLLGGRLRNKDELQTILQVVQKHFKCSVDPVKLFGLDGGRGSVASADTLALLHSSLPEGFQHLVWTDEFQTMAVLVHRAIHFDEPVLLVGPTGCGKTSLCQLLSALLGRKLYSINCHLHTDAADFLGGLRPVRNKQADHSSGIGLFEWSDGVVIQAMRAGGSLLIDEISLAGDAVLERLNSILETERKLVVSERTRLGGEVYEITASEGFTVFATMNPGGDYGKKELSPALRNRFVEIWCPVATTRKSYKQIIDHNLNHFQMDTAIPWGDLICNVVERLRDSSRVTVSARDLLTWVEFMNKTQDCLTPAQAFYHGAHLVFVDALGCGSSLGAASMKQDAVDYLVSLLNDWDLTSNDLEFCRAISVCDTMFGISPFYIDRGPAVASTPSGYSFSAPGPSENLFRLLRAMQLGKPLLLEGPPGVGKTSLVTSLAYASGNKIVRLNLSEQTDISDLFGADLPVEGGENVQFAWRDGPFLKALRRGDWIVLDEMNLASQSVLEGLNACLDHRGEVFIPELGKRFKVQCTSRLFACQNPLHQGGGRKGLPKSFVNRFTQVYMNKLSPADMLHICSQIFPQFDKNMLYKVVDFTCQVDTLVKAESGCNLWEFNLRDILRWCSLMMDHKVADPGLYVRMLYSSRLRQLELQKKVHNLYQEVFMVTEGSHYKLPSSLGQYFHVSKEFVQVGCAVLSKQRYQALGDDGGLVAPLHCQIKAMEVLAYCVKMGWMAIIVGKACTGKSSLVRSLAQLTGHKLLELSVTSVTDTTDLLGGYEQVNLRRHCVNVASQVLDNILCLLSHANQNPGLFQVSAISTIQNLAKELQKDYLPAVSDDEKDKQGLLNQCKRLADIAKTTLDITTGASLSFLHDLRGAISKLETLYTQVNSCSTSGRFEWVDSVLVEAVKYGHWLLISHANFCSPSVLDRLNALLEPGGVLTLDEKGIVGDHEPVIQPHPDFRLFLTMDPYHGEISRALKNRGIEVYIHHEESVVNVSRFGNDWRTILLLKSSLDSKFVTEILSAPSLLGLTPQQLITLARCSHSLSCEDHLNSRTAVERSRRILGMSADSMSEVESHPMFIEGGHSCQEIFIDPAICISRRDVVPLLKTIEHCRSHQTMEDNGTKVLNAALEVFVCSCSVDEKAYRLEILEKVERALVSSPLAFEISVWKSALKNTIWFPPLSTYGGHLFPTSNPLSLLLHGVDHHFPVTMLPFSAELAVLKATVEDHLNGASGHEKSLLQLSQQVYAGLKPKECLPHSSMVYLQPFISQVMGTISQLWLDKDILTTQNQSVQIQEFLDWFGLLISMCLKAHTSLPEFVSGWSLFKTYGLTPMLFQLKPQRGWESIHVHLLNMKPLEDCIRGTKVYDAILKYLYCLSEVSWNSLSLSEETLHYDGKILSLSSPREPFMMCPSSLVAVRLDNLSGSKSTLSHKDGSPECTDCLTGTFAVLSPLLVLVKGLLVQTFRDSSLHTLKDKIHNCLQYALRVYPLSLKSLSPLYHFHQCVASGELPRLHTGLVRSILNGFHQASKLPEGVLIERSFLSEKLFCLFSGNSNKISPMSTSYAITIGDLRSKREEITDTLQFIWSNESLGSFCVYHNMKLHADLIRNLFTVLVHTIQDVSAELSGSQSRQSKQIPQLNKTIVSNVCNEASKLFSGHVSEENFGTIEVCLLEVLDLLQHIDISFSSYTYWELIAQELSVLMSLHRAMAYLGLAHSILLAPTMIDPVALAAAQNKCHQAVMESTRILLERWYEHYQHMVGPGFQAVDGHPSLSFVPPVLSDLCSRLKDRKCKAGDLHISQPNCTKKYTELYQVALDIQRSLCAPAHCLKLLSILKDSGKQGSNIARIQSWVKAVNGGVQKLTEGFGDRPDIIDPFTMALTMMTQGIGSLSTIKNYQEEEPQKYQLESIRTLLQYPLSVEYESHCHWLENLVALLIQNETVHSEDFIQQRLLEVTLLACRNHLSQSKRRHKQLKLVVVKLLEHLWTKWKQAQQAAQAEAVEASSLYRWKVKEHDISQFNEDSTDEMQEKLFPSFDKIFSDRGHETSESDSTTNKVHQNVDPSSLSVLHMLLHNKQPYTVPVYKRSLEVQLYELSGLWHSKLKCIPGCVSDFQLYGAHIRMCNRLKDSLSQPHFSGFNVYKQGSIVEGERLLPIIRRILNRVTELLQEWPEHPILNHISRVCQGILLLSVDEPLMKLLTGSEYLLSKAQEWEAYASSSVSLKVELNNLMKLILDWRKLELNFYETMLEGCSSEVKAGVSQWWFHLYGLCSEVSDELSEFSSAIQSFMETSPLGEFSSRLQLISTFQGDMSIKGRDIVADVLGNVKEYYSQFVLNVTSTIDKLTTVVVKDFKDQLSVMCWNDGSYWSLKSSVQSSHKKLTSLLRKYRDILCDPVLPVLTEVSVDSPDFEQPLMTTIEIVLQSEALSVIEPENAEELVLYEDSPLVVTSQNALRTMSDVLKIFLTNTCSIKCVKELNEFTGNIIVSVDELSSNSFLDNLEEDKVESAIKSRQSLKRKMLSDLFKELSNQGFSFKKGQDFCSTSDILQMPLEDLPSEMSSVNALWNKMQYYYQRSISKFMAVQNAFVSPSKELTMYQISRCKGYTCSLLRAILAQRRALMLALRNYKLLKCAIDSIESSSTGTICVPTSDFSTWMKCLCDTLEQCLYVIHSMECLMSTSPTDLDHTLTPLPPDYSLKSQTREKTEQLACLKTHEKDLRLVYNDAIRKESCWSSFDQFFVTKQDVEFLQKGFICVLNFCSHLPPVQATLSAKSPIFFFLETYSKHLHEKCSHFTTWVSHLHNEEETQCDTSNTRLTVVKSILLAFQEIALVSKLGECEVEDTVLWKSVLARNSAVIECINAKQVTTNIKDFLVAYGSRSVKISSEHLKALVDMVTFYQRLCHAGFIQSMMVQATLCKLACTLFNIFSSLGSQGFCKPSKEAAIDHSGATDFVDMEAGGFSEGSGEKNVSSQAEPENMEPGKSNDQERNSSQAPDDDDDALNVDDDINEDASNIEHDETNSEDSEDNNDNEEGLDNTIGNFKHEDIPDDLKKELWAPEVDQREEDMPKIDTEGGTDVTDDTNVVAKDETLQESAAQELDQENSEQHAEDSDEAVDSMEPEQSDDLGDLDMSDSEEYDLNEAVESEEADCNESEAEVDDATEEVSQDEGEPGEDTVAMDSTDSSKHESGVFSTSEPAQNGPTQESFTPDSASMGPSVEFNAALQSGSNNSQDSMEDVNQSNHRRRSPKDQSRVVDHDLESTAKRARIEDQDKTTDVPNNENISLYRHINEAEDALTKNTVWDWSDSVNQSVQSSLSDQEEPSMEEQHSPVEKEKAMNIEAGSGGEVVSKKLEADEVYEEQLKATRLLSGNCIDSFFSRLKLDLSSQTENIVSSREEILSSVISLQLCESATLQNAVSLWRQYTSLTQNLSQALYEELCLILTPTSASQLRGDYRSGKRLNMRRVIPFIASNYQNDRIWLRRTKLVDRRYQVIVAVDDSSSMQHNECRQMAYESVAVITTAISRLTNGQVGVCRFGVDSELLHPLDLPFTDNEGGHLLQHLTFTQSATSYKKLLQTVKAVFLQYHPQFLSSTVYGRLLIILSDGRGVFSDGGVVIENAIRQLTECGVFTVFVILDTQKKDTITNLKVPMFSPEKGPLIARYLEVLPFPFYIIIRDLHKMPLVLAEALRQWFELHTNVA